MTMLNVQNVRRAVLAGAVTAVTIAGTLYGAGLKTESEVTQTAQRRQGIAVDERIASLQATRANLNGKKQMVEKQIRDLDAKIEGKEKKDFGTIDK